MICFTKYVLLNYKFRITFMYTVEEQISCEAEEPEIYHKIFFYCKMTGYIMNCFLNFSVILECLHISKINSKNL